MDLAIVIDSRPSRSCSQKMAFTSGSSTSSSANGNFLPTSAALTSATARPITPLHAIPYVHGSYASASPHFLLQSKFASILKRLLPGAYDELRSLMATTAAVRRESEDPSGWRGKGGNHQQRPSIPDPVKVMKWAENNPVVSAFGIWESDSGRRTIRCPANQGGRTTHADAVSSAKASFRRRRRQKAQAADSNTNGTSFEVRPSHNKPALEWDVFLDPKLVRQVSSAMEVVYDLESRMGRLARLRRQRQAQGAMHHCHTDDDDEEEYDLYQSHTAAQIEVDRLVSQLMKRMVLAHGSMSQLVLEAMGVAKDYNYMSVVKGVRETAAVVPANVENGRHYYSANRRKHTEETPPLAWDKEEEQRDFESLINPNNFKSGFASHDKENRRKNSGASSFVGSRGIFMENWLSVFSQALVLLKSDFDSGGKIQFTGPHSSSYRRRTGENIHIDTQPAQIGQAEGFGGFLRNMLFMRKNSSFPVPSPVPLEDKEEDYEEREVEDIDCASSDGDPKELHMPSLLDVSPRSQDSDAYDDMFSNPNAPTSSLGALCGVSLCFRPDVGKPPSSSHDMGYPSHNMSRDVQHISEVLGEPLRLVLDLKSRRVPPKVWSRLIDCMRSRGLVVDGIGSFDMDELRVIAKSCSCPLTPILFFHSVGDLQRACHANEVKKGDTVYFNGGSLMWKSTLMEAAERGCCGFIDTTDVDDVMSDVSSNKPGTTLVNKPLWGSKGSYSFQPYAYPRDSLSDWERVICKATLECYQKHFNLKVGVYVQEFSISPEALDALSCFVNAHGALYDQGLAFGGINGIAVKNIRGDGYWNQRYMGRSWDFNARPSNDMMPLKPEDHHIVQKAIQTGGWGQVASTYEVTEEQAGALTLTKREPCNFVQPGLGF
ncbi:hypothetical protein ACHAWX_005372 [Stephanocyclus meneghinianus]